MMNRRPLFLLCAGFFSVFYLGGLAGRAQEYPRDYFRNPLDIPILLSGNFGECRPNHFHTGIDIKTRQKENLKVYAAAEGYISRINISHSGYGNALYINHPNGYQTVYAHLNNFAPEIQAYLKKQQYAREKWNVDIAVPPSELKVEKGSFIAYSGNTGGSTSPHLHFEIRETESEEVLNPLLFGFEINDRIAPVIHSVAVYNAATSIHTQDPLIIPLKFINGKYIPVKKDIRIPFSKFYIGVHSDDKMNGSQNVLASRRMVLVQDMQEKVKIQLDRLSFDQSRYVNAYADFSTYQKTGKWYAGLYRLPNNQLDVYTGADGALYFLSDSAQIDIVISDAFGNESVAALVLYRSEPEASPDKCPKDDSPFVLITAPEFRFSTRAEYIYDPFCWQYSASAGNEVGYALQLMSPSVPLHGYADLSIKLKTIIPFDLRNKLYFIHYIKEDKLPGAHAQTGMAVTYDNGWANGKIRTFGRFEVAIDTVAPKISIQNKSKTVLSNQSIRFTVQEKETTVSACNAYIDGRWVCFIRSGNHFRFSDLKEIGNGEHELKVIAKDENDNERTFIWSFTIK